MVASRLFFKDGSKGVCAVTQVSFCGPTAFGKTKQSMSRLFQYLHRGRYPSLSQMKKPLDVYKDRLGLTKDTNPRLNLVGSCPARLFVRIVWPIEGDVLIHEATVKNTPRFLFSFDNSH